MTVNDIFKLMESPALLNGETLIQLKSLVEEYPYFQTVRMLYLKNLQMEKDLSFPMELRKMALYAGDRKKLYFWIEKDKFVALDIDALEKKEIFSLPDTFTAIESFLEAEGTSTSDLQIGNNMNPLVSTDYMSLLPIEEQDNLKNVQPLKHQKAIDDFLEKGKQTFIRMNSEDSENGEPATPQIKEKTDFFGETLAKIYIKQKKYEKALQIIQNLCLQYPEKSAYFAGQIEKLKKMIINNK